MCCPVHSHLLKGMRAPAKLACCKRKAVDTLRSHEDMFNEMPMCCSIRQHLVKGQQANHARTCKVGALQGAEAVHVLASKGGLSAEAPDGGCAVQRLGEARVQWAARDTPQPPDLSRAAPVVPLPCISHL